MLRRLVEVRSGERRFEEVLVEEGGDGAPGTDVKTSASYLECHRHDANHDVCARRGHTAKGARDVP